VQAPATAVYGQSYPFRLQVSDAEGGTFEKSMLLLVARPMHLPLLYAEGQNGPIIPPPPLPAAAAGQTEAVVVPLGPPWAEGTGLVESQAQQ
jgi:hypothetical protein